MSHIPPSPAPACAPTPYADLNSVLAELVSRLQATLADNFVGAYLQGSFAVGDFNAHSDVDLTLVVRDDIAEADVPALDALHAAVHDLPSPWAEHLEGSYFPAPILRRWSPTPRDPPHLPPRPADWTDPGMGGGLPARAYPLLYLNHGGRTLMRSEHDNSQVVRWVTREKGIVLFGPPPSKLIDPVPAEALKTEVRGTLARVGEAFLGRATPIDRLWLQSFLVTFCCRVLHTLQTGEIQSKKAGSEWASRTLDPTWAPLIERAHQAWLTETAVKLGPSDAAEVARTLDFLRYALGEADGATRAKAVIARALAAKHHGQPGPLGRHGVDRGRGAPGQRFRPAAPTRPGGRGRRG